MPAPSAPNSPAATCRTCLHVFAVAVALVLVGPAGPAEAQTLPGQSASGQGLPVVNPRASRPAGSVPLEGPVDAQEYLVGPGDVFSVSIGGVSPRQILATVSADGTLVVPEAGSFEASGRTLASVRGAVRAALQRQFSNVSTDVSLTTPREFYVHVTGAVPLPGRHVVRAVARVEDALAAAADGGNPRTLAAYDRPVQRGVDRRPSLRNVRLTRRNGPTVLVDLARYYAIGDVADNPYLRDGDEMNVSTFAPAAEGVFVNGAVERPGIYDLRPDDTLYALLQVASGARAEQALQVRLTRTGADGAPAVRDVSLAEARTLRLQPLDQVTVLSARPLAGSAEVVGEVRAPGAYPITVGTTTLRDLVTLAGGLGDAALLRGVYIERVAGTAPAPSTPAPTDAAGAPGAAESLDPGVLDLGNRSDLDLLERRYLQQEVLRTPRLSVDLEAALAGAADVTLQDGDRLVVPRDLGLVRVVGQVGRRGYVPYVEGQTAAYYVRAAGGEAPAASGVYVLDAATEQLAAGAERPVRPGDAVFVSRTDAADDPTFAGVAFQDRQLAFQERQEVREEQRARREARSQVVQTVLSAAGVVVSAVLAVAAINSSNN